MIVLLALVVELDFEVELVEALVELALDVVDVFEAEVAEIVVLLVTLDFDDEDVT